MLDRPEPLNSCTLPTTVSWIRRALMSDNMTSHTGEIVINKADVDSLCTESSAVPFAGVSDPASVVGAAMGPTVSFQ